MTSTVTVVTSPPLNLSLPILETDARALYLQKHLTDGEWRGHQYTITTSLNGLATAVLVTSPNGEQRRFTVSARQLSEIVVAAMLDNPASVEVIP